MEEKRGRLEELKGLEVVTKQLSKFVETGWKEAEKEPLASRLKTQVGIVATYKDKLQASASSVLEFCKDLMASETDFLLADYFKLCDLCEAVLRDGKAGMNDGSDAWNECLYYFVCDYDEFWEYEKKEKDGTDEYKLSSNGRDVLWHSRDENGGWKLHSLRSPRYSTITMKIYCHHRTSFPYRLCSRLVGYYWETDIDKPHFKHWGKIDMEKGVFIALVKAVYLYIALTNEEARLQDCKNIFLDNASQAPQTKAEAKKTGPVAIPHKLNTEEGRELLQNVIKAGFCDENYNWDSSKWDNGDDLIALAYFVEKANRYLGLIRPVRGKNIISWKPFDTLFTYRTKKKRADNKSQLQIARTNFMQYSGLKSFRPNTQIKDAIDALF